MAHRRPTSEQWRGFLAVCLAAALTCCSLGIALLVSAHHARRLGVALLVLALICAAVARLLWSLGTERPDEPRPPDR